MGKEALFYDVDRKGQINCRLCPHNCLIPEGQTGRCRVRRHLGKQLISLNYGLVAALAIDPVEKKPLYHFLPGSQTLSFAGAGCNLSCRNCQNHNLSQISASETCFGSPMSPQNIVDMALEQGLSSISFTYSEPTVFYEMMLECAQLAREVGLKTILVSNGFINPEPLNALIPFLDAANIDLKAYSDHFYQSVCGGHLQPVLNTLHRLHAEGVWLEITTLLIPGHNDNPVELDLLISFIAEMGHHIPWHVSRFFPQYQFADLAPTSGQQIVHLLERARERGLLHLYAGNLPQNTWQSTLCSHCQAVLIQRNAYQIEKEKLGEDGCCLRCKTPLAGIFSQSDR